ncbi:hypothetical protein HYDPIDRAFT_33593 [Hydnomerulius pinastri MD-312]|uniref:Uncharacterized protein n=1 Tax=Hydnomerulius pinastri MD-312 TaxID=994086 RepID=A0A0C9V183_9AGAM|nr:hypothetical protein HYDPIDRAFT_33593 [Hydnomerulius pinastri MD-312]
MERPLAGWKRFCSGKLRQKLLESKLKPGKKRLRLLSSKGKPHQVKVVVLGAGLEVVNILGQIETKDLWDLSGLCAATGMQLSEAMALVVDNVNAEARANTVAPVPVVAEQPLNVVAPQVVAANVQVANLGQPANQALVQDPPALDPNPPALVPAAAPMPLQVNADIDAVMLEALWTESIQNNPEASSGIRLFAILLMGLWAKDLLGVHRDITRNGITNDVAPNHCFSSPSLAVSFVPLLTHSCSIPVVFRCFTLPPSSPPTPPVRSTAHTHFPIPALVYAYLGIPHPCLLWTAQPTAHTLFHSVPVIFSLSALLPSSPPALIVRSAAHTHSHFVPVVLSCSTLLPSSPPALIVRSAAHTHSRFVPVILSHSTLLPS